MQFTARSAALAALERCRRDGAWSGASLDSIIKKYSLDSRDAALASRICLGVLQNSSLCDYYIDCFSTAKSDRLEPKVRDILRTGVYQILFLSKIPNSAAVNESVRLCKSCGYSRAAGLVNAVLRKIAENADNLPEIPGKSSPTYLSVKYSHPLWLCEKIAEERGVGFAEGFFAANNLPPPLTIQINTLKVSTEEYLHELENQGKIFELRQPEGCADILSGSVQELPGYEEGLFYVQDAAARMAAEIAAPEAGMRVLDLCSAPGGKSFACAIRMKDRGSILSRDIHEKKLRLVSEGAERLGITCIRCEAGDARQPDDRYKGYFDLVIADVPCSGLGVIRKKPEIRLKKKEEISGLPEIQKKILDAASACVRPGGVLLYSTCTVLREENEDIVQAFLREHEDFCTESFRVGNVCADDGVYTFWPHRDGTDGFFAAKLRRKY